MAQRVEINNKHRFEGGRMTMTEDGAAQQGVLPEADDSQAQPAAEPTKKRRNWIPLLVCAATVGILWLIVSLAPSASAAGGCGGG